jgi:hypothetical protein
MANVITESNYAFKHNDDAESNYKTNTSLNLSDAPPLTRFLLKMQPSRSTFNKIAYVIMCIIYLVPNNYIVMGVAILNNPAIGIVSAIYGPTCAFVWITQPSATEIGTFFHSMVFANEKSLKQYSGKLKQQFVITNIAIAVMNIVIYVILIIPMIGTTTLLSNISNNDNMLYTFIVSNVLLAQVNTSCMIPGDVLLLMFADVRAERTRAYIANIHNILLDKENGDQLDVLTKEQRKTEQFALETNQAIGSTNSAKIFMMVSWIVILLCSAAFVSASSSANKLRPIICCCMMCLFFVGMVLQVMSSITSPSKAWNSACDLKLNDASLSPVINQLFGGRADFDLWLKNHEMSTQRLFGVKVSMELIGRVGSVLASGVLLAVYLIARQELSNMM